MKETKTFFTNDNRLNKGYSYRNMNKRPIDNSFYRKKFENILPPIDVMSQYEDLNPGTLAHLIDMAKQEQSHRHSIDLVNIKSHNAQVKLGRMSSLIFSAFICITTIVLATTGHVIPASIFSGSVFGLLGLIFFLSKCNSDKTARHKSAQS